ncbi:MAG: DNA helicase UvrD [Betaproteobacteria bacterium]|nr:DNA helicase UvrD [Betaproteobacteria bacterium]
MPRWIQKNIQAPASTAIWVRFAGSRKCSVQWLPMRRFPMNSAAHPPDAAQRAQALDTKCSFIVQAPAGSGKTELLVQRFLALLATLEAPEEAIAITFTRKAAAEMRQRVLEALDLADHDQAPREPHRYQAWMLARAVREQDRRLDWGLMEAPARLRIQTFDSLCASLCRQMPLVGGFGAQYKAIEDAGPMYIEAAQRTLVMLHEDTQWAACIGQVLAHLDNDFAAAQSLLVEMLRKRDQWLRHVTSQECLERQTLEESLAHMIEDDLAWLLALFPMQFEQELVALARYAAGNLEAQGRASPIRALLDLPSLPGTRVQDLPGWLAIAELLLTQAGSLRATVDARIGFPAAKAAAAKRLCDEYKARYQSFRAVLAVHDEFLEALHATRELPPAQYTGAQWAALEALMEVLPLAAAQLTLVFQEQARVDFAAISQAAIRAMGASDAPTDLALSLDYRIRHLLVDEFQDTSQSQYQLLECLTAGWQPGDGRTLFAVGDPMQSIYRFREAEVGLYLRARASGIGSVRLEPLTLSANFRSDASLVDWSNECFSKLLPKSENTPSGAVPFSPSTAMRTGLPAPGVSVHALIGGARQQEAARVRGIIEDERQRGSEGRIAILVSSRTHLTSILPALRHAGFAVQAVEIESLADRPVVMDLSALARALAHPADRIAWLAVLRAPWCGLGLADLEVLASAGGRPHDRPILETLRSMPVLESMSVDGRMRAADLASKLSRFMEDRQRQPVRRWVEGAWTALGGPASYDDANALADAQVFFELLDALEEEGGLDAGRLSGEVKRLFASANTAGENPVQVMTIHKAKGLEFDTVIIPGLGYKRAADAQQLLRWMEWPRPRGGSGLLLAPIGINRSSDDPIYRALSRMERVRARHEEVRLLYVAATRAKSSLHLIGHLNIGSQGQVRAAPNNGSLLEHLWPVIGHHFGTLPLPPPVVPSVGRAPRPLRRRLSNRELPFPAAGIRGLDMSQIAVSTAEVEFSWASEAARTVGVVVHRVLQRIAAEGAEHWTSTRTGGNSFERDLRELGLPDLEIPAATARIRRAVIQVMEDPRGRWILSSHQEAGSEVRLTGLLDGQLITAALDRTFIDDHGVRWIIDFKTGTHEGAGLAQFLDREQARYIGQLERYAALMRQLGEQRPIRLGLYFPIMRQWRQWEPTSHN